jgi:Na+/pantothenate symporter
MIGLAWSLMFLIISIPVSLLQWLVIGWRLRRLEKRRREIEDEKRHQVSIKVSRVQTY